MSCSRRQTWAVEEWLDRMTFVCVRLASRSERTRSKSAGNRSLIGAYRPFGRMYTGNRNGGREGRNFPPDWAGIGGTSSPDKSAADGPVSPRLRVLTGEMGDRCSETWVALGLASPEQPNFVVGLISA